MQRFIGRQRIVILREKDGLKTDNISSLEKDRKTVL